MSEKDESSVIELPFGFPQRQFHSEQKIMESRYCGPDVHCPAMSTFIQLSLGCYTLLVFLPSAKVKILDLVTDPLIKSA